MNRTSSRVLAAASALLLAACATTTSHDPAVRAEIVDAARQAVGTATLTEAGGGVRLRVSARGLTPGRHGIHLHATGTCEGPGFTTAAGHLNPAGRKHGQASAEGPHAGDLPNLVVGADGTGHLDAVVAGVTLAAGGTLFDADGTAVVIHAGEDDQVTDPAGNSGARIACGVVTSS